jgi:hypothetical protein
LVKEQVVIPDGLVNIPATHCLAGVPQAGPGGLGVITHPLPIVYLFFHRAALDWYQESRSRSPGGAVGSRAAERNRTMLTIAAPITWQTDYQTALAQAKIDHRSLLVYFHKPH